MSKSHIRNATNFHGKPKGWTFDGGFNLGFEGSWVSGSKNSKSSILVQLGNAVPCKLSEAIAKQVKIMLNSN